MVEIRRVESLDEALLDDLCDLFKDAVDGGASVGFMAPLEQGTARRFWQSVFAALDDGVILWVATDGGRIVGSVQLSLCKKENGPHRAEAQKLLTLTSHRRQGVASRLMATLENFARAEGRTLLVLDTEASSGAEAFYQHLGWRRVGEIPDFALNPHGGLRPTALYCKILD